MVIAPTSVGNSEMKVSAVLSIHNRSKLFRRALDGYAWQTMDREDWEIILVDDMSTEDISETYRHLIGQINLRHIRMDHTQHSVFKKRNPDWQPGMPQDWFHTPAISINIGASLAQGEVICLCHPEILHAPENFINAHKRLIEKREKKYLFGETWLGTIGSNYFMDEAPYPWTHNGWERFIGWIQRTVERKFEPNELYWYLSFLPKSAIEAVRGVDFEYLNGVAGEDDDFKERVKRAGWPPLRADEIQGFHQNHSDEQEPHRRRDTLIWEKALERNRSLLARQSQADFPMPINSDVDWTAQDCIVEVVEYRIGSKALKG